MNHQLSISTFLTNNSQTNNLLTNNFLTNYLPKELLIYISNYLIEPTLIITNIGWNKYTNNYYLEYDKIHFQKSLKKYHDVIKYQIINNNINNLYNLYLEINNLNNTLRKYMPTYIFSDIIFKKYKYITYRSLINLEYDKELNIQNKEIEICNIHIASINNIKKNILKELKFFIKKYFEFQTNSHINKQNNLLINIYIQYPFYLYILDNIQFYI